MSRSACTLLFLISSKRADSFRSGDDHDRRICRRKRQSAAFTGIDATDRVPRSGCGANLLSRQFSSDAALRNGVEALRLAGHAVDLTQANEPLERWPPPMLKPANSTKPSSWNSALPIWLRNKASLSWQRVSLKGSPPFSLRLRSVSNRLGPARFQMKWP